MDRFEDLEDEIDLLELFFILLNRWQLIALTTFICMSATFTYFHFTTEREYKAGIKVYVNADTLNLGTSISISDINASNSLVPIYKEILDTHLVLDKVGQRLSSKGYSGYDYYNLTEMIESSSINSTPVFEVAVTDTNPQRAIIIANTIAEVLPDEIAAIIDGSSARIVDRALSAEGLSRGVARRSLIAAFIGMMLSCAYVLLVDYFLNDSIKDTLWLDTNYRDIPILGKVPDAALVSNSNAYYRYESKNNKEGSAQ